MKKYTVKVLAISGKSREVIRRYASKEKRILNVVPGDRLLNVDKLIDGGFIKEATEEQIKAFDSLSGKKDKDKKVVSNSSNEVKSTKPKKDDSKSTKSDGDG